MLDRHGTLVEVGRVTKVLAFRGLERTPIEEGFAGDIVSIAGLPEAFVSHTVCAPEVTEPLPAQPIDPPTLAMTFRIMIRRSPVPRATKYKAASSASVCYARRKATLRFGSRNGTRKISMEVAGRGELQLGILIETMRREGFELSVSRPKVLFQYGAGE